MGVFRYSHKLQCNMAAYVHYAYTTPTHAHLHFRLDTFVGSEGAVEDPSKT